MPGIFAVRPGKIAPGETKVIYCIQQIGFAAAVRAGNANNTLLKIESCLGIIPELYQ